MEAAGEVVGVVHVVKRDWFLPFPDLSSPPHLLPHHSSSCDRRLSLSLSSGPPRFAALFASIGQVGVGLSVTANPPSPDSDTLKMASSDLSLKFTPTDLGYRVLDAAPPAMQESSCVGDMETTKQKQKKKNAVKAKEGRKGWPKFKIKISNPHLRRLVSGGIAGAVSRTCVAPLETIRTHLMVGSNGNSSTEVFQSIMNNEGWTGLFRGNFVNVIRVAPSKAIELFAFDTANKFLSPKDGEPAKLPVPSSLVAGAFAGVSSTICTYPLELIKTRLTIERGVYKNFLDAFVKIIREEGASELYRGLTPSLIGVVPYAASNYFAYETLKKLYRKVLKKKDINNIATLLIGSAAGAMSSSATFPLEVARKHMQVGNVGGRHVYKNMLDALLSIMEKEGVGGLYKGLGPSCMKLVPAAGISFMCYEALKKILVDEEE